ncbi:hypothetical protein B0T09DRAFT_327983 [Sordaria sp. MPI-SDFR-AT-0083]|nr:hypothetical protein B0T09DRAFT_327983 [Sordaria sp. MPI-SDFR-AT-0083]
MDKFTTLCAIFAEVWLFLVIGQNNSVSAEHNLYIAHLPDIYTPLHWTTTPWTMDDSWVDSLPKLLSFASDHCFLRGQSHPTHLYTREQVGAYAISACLWYS